MQSKELPQSAQSAGIMEPAPGKMTAFSVPSTPQVPPPLAGPIANPGMPMGIPMGQMQNPMLQMVPAGLPGMAYPMYHPTLGTYMPAPGGIIMVNPFQMLPIYRQNFQ